MMHDRKSNDISGLQNDASFLPLISAAALRYHDREMIRRFLPRVVLLLFVSFQTFQLWDATGDTVESLQSCARALSHQHSSWFTASTPFDDPDAELPFVSGQSLAHRILTHRIGVAHRAMVPFGFRSTLTSLASPDTMDRSPPLRYVADRSDSIKTFLLDRSPERNLAPPLA